MPLPPSLADHYKIETFDSSRRWRRPFWVGITDNFTQHFASVESSGTWRKHLMGSKPEGILLRKALTQKFSSTTMMLSVILAVEIGVLTSPAQPADDVRLAFKAQEFRSLEYWAGMALGWAIFVSIGAVISNYTAWGIFSTISNENLRMIARSQIGVYSAQLPSFLILITLWMFVLSVILFWFVIMPLYAAIGLSVAMIIFIVYIISTYSALGSLVMYSGALSPDPIIVNETTHEDMTDLQISEELMRMKRQSIRFGYTVSQQYAEVKMRNVRYRKTQSMQELLSCSSHHGGGFAAALQSRKNSLATSGSRSLDGSFGLGTGGSRSLDGSFDSSFNQSFRARALLEKNSRHERIITYSPKKNSVDPFDRSLGSSIGSLSSYASFGSLESIAECSYNDNYDNTSRELTVEDVKKELDDFKKELSIPPPPPPLQESARPELHDEGKTQHKESIVNNHNRNDRYKESIIDNHDKND